jgi:hypothetical protein
MRLSLPHLVALGLSLAACGSSYTSTLPDGGRGSVNCPGDMPSVSMTVLGKAGAPAPAATVSATWLSYDISDSYVTDARGVAVLKAQFGPGIVRVRASLNDLSSQSAEITFAGGQCVNVVTPREVVLQLQ